MVICVALYSLKRRMNSGPLIFFTLIQRRERDLRAVGAAHVELVDVLYDLVRLVPSAST